MAWALTKFLLLIRVESVFNPWLNCYLIPVQSVFNPWLDCYFKRWANAANFSPQLDEFVSG